MNSKWKAALALITVFAAGAVFGIVGTRMVVRYTVQQILANPQLVQQRVELNLARRLRLDPMQRRRLNQVLMQSQQQLQQLRMETQPRFVGIVSNAETQVDALLTPEQQRQFQFLKQENRRLLPLGPPPFPFQRPAGQRASGP
jgi:hypothetical protein